MYNWFPQKELSVAVGLFMNGGSVSSIVASSLSGYVSEYFGWPYVFYFCGALNLLFLLMFTPLTSSKPDLSRFVNNKELAMISNAKSVEICEAKKPAKVPWSRMFTSMNVLMYLAYCVLDWSSFMYDAKFPTYLSDVLHMHPGRVSK